MLTRYLLVVAFAFIASASQATDSVIRKIEGAKKYGDIVDWQTPNSRTKRFTYCGVNAFVFRATMATCDEFREQMKWDRETFGRRVSYSSCVQSDRKIVVTHFSVCNNPKLTTCPVATIVPRSCEMP